MNYSHYILIVFTRISYHESKLYPQENSSNSDQKQLYLLDKHNQNVFDMSNKRNLMEVFQQEAPEVAQAFGGLIQSVSSMKALEPKMKQLIYIAMRASQGETSAVLAHIPMAKRDGATRDEIKETIIMTTTVCGIKGVASCLAEALDLYDSLS